MTRTMETNEQMLYSANDVAPAFPVHPGEILGEELSARGISGKEFAQMTGMQTSHLSAIIHGTRNITQAVAEKLAQALDGISAEFWLRLQKSYNTEKNRRTKGLSRIVTGYSLAPATFALADPGTEYGSRCQVQLSIPSADRPLLELLASRLNWKVL